MSAKNLFRSLLPLLVAVVAGSACEAQELDQLEELEKEWIQNVEVTGELSVKRIYKTGEGVENKCNSSSGQGGTVRDGILYRLYHGGACQTFDISDLAHPVKTGSFKLQSTKSTNHSNCAQSWVEDGDLYLYVAGLRGKCFVERITETGSVLVQTIVLPALDIFNGAVGLNIICGDDGNLWLFGSSGSRLYFAKAKRPDLKMWGYTLGEEDILDFWSEDGYVYAENPTQGGMVYDNLLFMLFGNRGAGKHLAVYDTRTHTRIKDIDLSIVKEEPEDCDMVPQGILVVTNGGSNYYLVRPE